MIKPHSPAYKCLFIDLDDTLWATYENNCESLTELYTALNWGQYFVSCEAFLNSFWPHNDFLWSEYRHGRINKDQLTLSRFQHPFTEAGHPLTTAQIEDINSRFLNLCAQKRGICPGAIEVLEYLHGKYAIYILSNGFREVQQRKMDAAGLTPHVDGMVLSEDAGINKPHKEIFDYAFEVSGYSPEACIMIGDSWDADIEGASNGGVSSIWYNPKHNAIPADTTARHPIRTITHLTELIGYL